jgi:exopolysaccharide production protein ExoZ
MRDRFASIQIVRAVAALSVVLFHSHFVVASYPKDQIVKIPFIYEWGYLGVDLFFVVSGFIIAHIGNRDGFSITPFLARRFFRIYPIYWIYCALAVYLYFQHGYSLGGGNLSLSDVIKAFAIFPLEKHPAYAVGWTLEHEILFYVISGIALWLGGMRFLILVLSMFATAGMLRSVLTASHLMSPFWDYHLLSAVHVNFLTGVVVYMAQKRLQKLRVVIPFATSLLLFFAWVKIAGCISSEFAEVTQTLIVSVASASLIVAFLNVEKLYACSWFWRNRLTGLLVLIGNASFSLYLLHWVVFIEMGRTKWTELLVSFKLGFFTWSWHYVFPVRAAEYYRFSLIFITIAASILLYYLVEKPVTSFGHSLARRIELRKAEV